MKKESFHLDGKVPVVSDNLKMCRRGNFNPSAQSLTKEWGSRMPLKPQPLKFSKMKCSGSTHVPAFKKKNTKIERANQVLNCFCFIIKSDFQHTTDL
jgi:hypothetical protein